MENKQLSEPGETISKQHIHTHTYQEHHSECNSKKLSGNLNDIACNSNSVLLLSQCKDVCLTVHQSESMDGKTDEDGSLQSRERLCIGVREVCALVQDVATHPFFLVGCGKVCPDNQVFFSSHSPRVTQTNTLPQSQNFLLSPGRSTLPLIPPSLRLLLSLSLSVRLPGLLFMLQSGLPRNYRCPSAHLLSLSQQRLFGRGLSHVDVCLRVCVPS